MGPDWAALQGAIAGDVILPGSSDYEEVRKPFFARFHGVHPQAVVLCGTPSDVAETVALAVRSGLHFAIRSGGHCFAGRSSSQGSSSTSRRCARCPFREASSLWRPARGSADVYQSLQQHGLMIPRAPVPPSESRASRSAAASESSAASTA